MEIGNINSPPVHPVRRNQHSAPEKREQRPESSESVSVAFKHAEIAVDYTSYARNGAVNSMASVQPDTVAEELGIGEIAWLRNAIHAEVLAQVKDFLGTYFEENPEAVEQISRGEIPEYFNVENTARRILNIYFATYEEGQDRKTFVERAKGIIEQAYADVAGMVGELPDIVLQTRAKVMEILDTFANGGDVSDFMQMKIG